MADVASLAVALHLNSAAFKSESVEAFNGAASSAKKFTDTVRQQSASAGAAISKIAVQAGHAGTQFDGLQGHISKASTGLEQFRSMVNSLAGGSNIALSTIANAMVPSLDRLFVSLNTTSGGWKAQQEAARQAATVAETAAAAEIAQAQAARTQAQAQMTAAQRTQAAAQASRTQAQELARYLATQSQVNKELGLNVSYQDDYVKINRQVTEANLAETAAQAKLAAVTEAVTAADAAEAAGKVKLAAAIEAISVANQKVSFTTRAASAASGLWRGLLSLVGGLPGLGILAGVSAITALYAGFEQATKETQAFNAAILQNYGAVGMTADQLRGLAVQLGDTDGAVKSVTAAVKAGFTGDMLEQVAALGAQINDMGGDADTLVRQLTSLRGDPLKAIQQLTSEGLVFNASQIEQIASLERQGNIAEATALAQRILLDLVNQKLKDQQTEIQNTAGWWDKLKEKVSGALSAIGQADIDNARVMSNMMGVDMDKPARDAQAVADQQKKQAEEKQKQAVADQNAALARIKTESEINAAIKAGADPKKEAARLTAEITAEYKSGKMSLDDYNQALKGVDKEFGNHKKASTAGVNDGRNMLIQLQEQEAALRAQVDDSNKLTASQKKLAAFNAEVAGFDKNHLTTGQKSILAMQDQIRAQLQVNAGLEQENANRALALKFQQENAELTQATAEKQQTANNSLAEMTLSSPAYEQMTAEQQIRNDFAARRLKLDKETTNHSSDLYRQETDFLATEQQRQLDIVANTAAEKQKIDGSYSIGFKKGVTDWAVSASNAYEQMKDFATSSFDSMASGLATFVTTGKLNFSTLAKSIIADLIKIQLQVAASSALQSIFGIGSSLLSGVLGGGASSTASTASGATGAMGLSTSYTAYAKGDVFASPDLGRYRNNIVNQPTFFAFASGAGVMGEAGPEAIMPLTRASDGSLGVRAVANGAQQSAGAPQVNIYITDSGNTSTQSDTQGYQQFGNDIGAYVDQRYRTLRDRDLGQGGAISRAIKGRK
ncbi:phage tail tape measure protein [Martelella alba]|uniref:Phage tail tape measure protein n=1 Tax=Martelella alba TaxID=2590451 RepID=A0ABY2SE93_9HYPH|nr:phage tail tape measure protein [Martelella alba]TKI02665.1 phage tail tape measure protein [Martelella alba]